MRLKRPLYVWTALLWLARTAEAQSPSPENSGPPAASFDMPSDAPEVWEARDAFRLGTGLAAQGQWLDALAAFVRSARLRPHPVTTYNVAYCERSLARFVRARRDFLAALQPPAASSDADRLPQDLEQLARGYLAEVEQQVVRVTITLETHGVSLKVDGHSLEPMQPDGNDSIQIVSTEEPLAARALPHTFDLWLDPGPHVFLVTGPGASSSVENHSFLPGSSTALTLSSAPPSVERGAGPASPPADDGHPSANGVSLRTLGFVVGGVGIAGLGLSGYFALRSSSLNEESKQDGHCDAKTGCDATGYEKRSDALVAADVATISLIAGSVLTAGGVALVLFGGRKQAESRPSATAVPMIGPGTATVLVRGRF